MSGQGRHRGMGGPGGLPGLEQLLRPGKALGDVHPHHAPRVEGAHGELGPWLADGLGRDHPHGGAQIHQSVEGKIHTVTELTHTLWGLAGGRGTDHDPGPHPHLFHPRGKELIHKLRGEGLVPTHQHHPGLGVPHILHSLRVHGPFPRSLLPEVKLHLQVPHPLGSFPVDQDIAVYQYLTGAGIEDGLRRHPAVNALGDRLHDAPTSEVQGVNFYPLTGPAVVFPDHHVHAGVHQPAGEIASIGGPEGGVGRALTPTMGGDEVLDDGKALTEVGDHRPLDNPPPRVGHGAAHPGKLLHLAGGATRAGSHDPPHRVKRVLGQVPHRGLLHLVHRLPPHLDHRLEPLGLGGQPPLVHPVDPLHLGLGLPDELLLLRRDLTVGDGDGEPRQGGILEPKFLDPIQKLAGTLPAVTQETLEHLASGELGVKGGPVIPEVRGEGEV